MPIDEFSYSAIIVLNILTDEMIVAFVSRLIDI